METNVLYLVILMTYLHRRLPTLKIIMPMRMETAITKEPNTSGSGQVYHFVSELSRSLFYTLFLTSFISIPQFKTMYVWVCDMCQGYVL